MQRVYVHPRRAVFGPLYTLFEKRQKVCLSLENKWFIADFRASLKMAIFHYESPALTAELPDRWGVLRFYPNG
jgi:hypothetical protein